MITSMYIHIPFCKTICSYCDFCKVLYHVFEVSNYIEALRREIRLYYSGEPLKTLYIGGGTPSSLSMKELSQLFQIIDTFSFKENYEFTFECNVEHLTEELLVFLKKHRVNRLSIGIQTFQEKFLSFLKRNHTKQEAIEKVLLAKKVGFYNINLDFMYAFPNETIEDVKQDLEIYLSLDVPHISMYSLILEEHTLLAVNKIKPIDEELDAMMYDTICQALSSHGYYHYEISNFSLPGYESQHNLTYWNNKSYYGFGLGASGYVEKVRYSNTRNMKKYLSGNFRLEEEPLTINEEMSYEMILGLRKREGVSKQKFYQKYGKKIEEQYDIIDLLENHLLEENEEYFYIPESKLYISNEILLRFI